MNVNEDEIEMAAAEHVLGVTTHEERAAALARLETDARFARLVAQWERRLAPLALAAAAAPAPAGMLAAIEARIAALDAGLEGTRTLRAAARSWQSIGPGLSVSMLSRTSDPPRQTLLLRCEPGAQFPDHDHAGDEEFLVLEGDFVMGALELKAGDYHFAPKGLRHPRAFTRSGCVLLVTAAL